MVSCLLTMNRLELLTLDFYSPRSCSDRASRRPPPFLHLFTRFRLCYGASGYCQDHVEACCPCSIIALASAPPTPLPARRRCPLSRAVNAIVPSSSMPLAAHPRSPRPLTLDTPVCVSPVPLAVHPDHKLKYCCEPCGVHSRERRCVM